MNEVAYAVEGWADEPVAAKLIAAVGCLPHRILTAGGKSNLDPKIPGYNASARYRPWLVLRDLDQDDEKECIPEILVRLAAGQLSRCFALRLPVRATEAWILADATAFSTFFHVPAAMVPADPDTLRQPKSALVDACRASRSRDVRTAMVPRPPSGSLLGQSILRLFVTSQRPSGT